MSRPDWTKPHPDAPANWLTLGRALGDFCTEPGCPRRHHAQGLCHRHYHAMQVVERERRVHGYVPIDDVEWLLECDPRMTAAQLAPRFDVQPASVIRALHRAGRGDLVAQLNRNARLAGASIPERAAS